MSDCLVVTLASHCTHQRTKVHFQRCPVDAQPQADVRPPVVPAQTGGTRSCSIASAFEITTQSTIADPAHVATTLVGANA